MLKNVMNEHADLGYSNVCYRIIVNYSSKNVSPEFDYDEDGCEMHNVDKINRLYTWDLTR